MSSNAREKIIVALDFDNIESAREVAKDLIPHVGALKVGLELINSCGAPQVVSEFQVDGGKIFFDGKFKDIPNTVAGAARAVTRLGVWMFNLHALGGRKMMEDALEAAERTAKSSGIRRPLITAVTILTSFDEKSLAEIGIDVRDKNGIEEEVVKLAALAKSAGLDGVVASPKEIRSIRDACGADFKIVTPGIRPQWAATDDQKRITTPADAVKLGADYLVIGRPITRPPKEIGSPVDAAKRILEEISNLTENGGHK